MRKENYKFHKTGSNTIVAESTFAGRRVKGYAKLCPTDSFNEEYGKKLAAARCNQKIAEKRFKRASAKFQEALEMNEKAQAMMHEMNEYYHDSVKNLCNANKRVFDVLNECE